MAEGWSTPFLLIGMVLTSALALVATEWTSELELIPVVGVAGLLAGVVISVSAFRTLFSHFLSAVYGVFWVGFLVGRGLPEDLSWRERIFELGTRVVGWTRQALGGGTSQDSLIFLLFLSVLFWFLSYYAAWNTYRRRRAWLAAFPLGTVPVVAAHFYIGEAPLLRYLILYLLLALIYVGRAEVSAREDDWRREHVAYDPKLGTDVVRSSFVLALMVLVLAWALPITSSASTSVSEIWERVNSPWETLEEEWQRLFSTIHSGEREVDEPFGSSLLLGGPSGLDDTPVLDIEAPPVGRYYWRAAVYATYNGTQWDLPGGDLVPLSTGREATASADDAARRDVTQTVINYLAGRHLLVGASEPAAVDREAEALARVEDGTPLAFYRVSSTLPLGAGESYTVTSHVSLADAPSLRQAGTDYPDWVREAYLQLPNTLPQRVRVLAERITSGADTPYEKTRLLERYLRDNITYDLSPPAVPRGRDYVDFLLFDSQRGYCNGYATAMVVMARSVGIPARLATGYAQGTFDEERAMFRVRENNAHSWPEVYFPGYGWIEFEPTVSEDPLIRPEADTSAGPDPSAPSGTEEDLTRDLRGDLRNLPIPDEGPGPGVVQDAPAERPSIWPWAAALAVVLLVAAVRWATENLGFRRLAAADRAYARLLRFGTWLGRPLQTPDTPLEWARDISDVVPDAEEPVTQIVALYLRARFGQGDARDPAATISWDQASPKLWRHLLWRQWLIRLGLVRADPEPESTS